MSKWRVGIYLRLSSEDKSKISDESNSITNQRELIKSYISKDKSLELINVYKDDGFTGTDFDRPGFQNLYEDSAKNHKSPFWHVPDPFRTIRRSNSVYYK